MKNLIFFFLAVALGLSSCTSYVRVVTLKSNSPAVDSTRLLFENDTMRIQYDYYLSGAGVVMTVYNKLKKPLYIDWGQSAYIMGNQKQDYWVNSTTIAFSPEDHTATIDQADRYSYIPPATSVQKYESLPMSVNFITMTMKYAYYQKIMNEGMSAVHQDSVKVSETDFVKQNTPLVFRNFLTLSLDSKFNSAFFIDHEFWISSVKDMKADAFLGTYVDQNTGNAVNKNPFKSTNCFYIKYNPNNY